MKNNVKITCLFLIVIVCIASISIPSHGLSDGDTFSYTLTKAEAHVDIDTTSYDSTGMYYSTNHPVGTIVGYHIREMDYTFDWIRYTYMIGGHDWLGSQEFDWFSVGDNYFENYLTITSYLTYRMATGDADEDLLQVGVRDRVESILIPANTYKNLFQNQITGHTHQGSDYETIFETLYQDLSDGSYSFESWQHGYTTDSTEDFLGVAYDTTADVEYSNQFHLIFNSSGIILGLGYHGTISGTMNGKTVDVELVFEYEINGFTMPDYNLGTNGLPGFTILAGFIPILMVTTVFIVKKKRLKNS